MDHLNHKFEDNSNTAKDVVLFTDSESALRALEGGELDEALQEITRKAEHLTSTYSVKLKLQWIPGHADIYGNDKADALAKKGSQKAQPIKPITLSTAKQKIKQTYRKEWMKQWENGSTGRQVYAHMKTTKPKDNLKLLKRKDQTTIFQLRTQHVPLNYHRNRLNPEVPPNCPLCDYPYETTEHVLLNCNRLEDLRHTLLPSAPTIENTLYCSKKQLEQTANFYYMSCARRVTAQRLLD